MSFNLIDINDLEYWSGQPNSKTELPLVISRLARMTTPALAKLYIPKGRSIYRGGWDGRIEAATATEFIPVGVSLWEFGTEKSPSGKAEKDFRKRTDGEVAEEIKDATFVFVTTRFWEKSQDWVTERKAEGKWKDIRVIDGNLLVEWLSTSTLISQQLAGFSGVKIRSSLESLEQFWENWSIGPNGKRISPKLLVAGRKKEMMDLFGRLDQPASVIEVQASAKDEALAFCAAAVTGNDEYREKVLSKTVIVENEDDFKILLHEPSCVLIPRFPVNSIIYTAVTKGHHVVHILGAEDKSDNEDKIVLPKLGREEILEALAEQGIAEDQARALSRETGRNISVIRRRLGFTGMLPEWARPENYTDLLPALLAGKWDENKEGDRVVIAQLAGMPYESYTEKLRKWLVHHDSPIVTAGSHWRIVSALDAWTYLGTYLSKLQLETLADGFLFACGDIKPALSLEPDKRYMAAFYGKLSDFSHHIREGLTQSLVLIALYGENYQLQIPSTPQIWVDRLVSRLCNKQDQQLWKSLDDILPLVAEASPGAFLGALETFLNQAPDVLRGIFEEAAGFISPAYYHTGMLWALEGLAWLPPYFARSCFALLKLHELDPGVKIQNRPINSIYTILNPWMPQTFAVSAERKAVIGAIAERQQEAAWSLCLGLLPSGNMAGHMTHQLRWRQYQMEQLEVLSDAIYADFLNFIADTLYRLSLNDTQRLVTLLGRFDDFWLADKQRVIAYLKDNAATFDDSFQAIWSAIREILHNQHLDYREDWFIPDADIQTLWELYRFFTPTSRTVASLWVFNEHWPRFPEGFGKAKDNGTAQEAFIREKRVETLKVLYRESGFAKFLDLVTIVNEPWIFGSVASMVPLKPAEKADFAALCASQEPNQQAAARGFISQTHFSKGIKASNLLFEKLKRRRLNDEGLTAFLLCCRSEIDIWQLVEAQSPQVYELYWKKCEGNFWDKAITHQEYQIERLADAGRYYTILHICNYNVENHSTERLMTVLEKIAAENITDAERLDRHELIRLMEELYKRPEADQTRLARLEWAYLDFLTRGYNRSKPNLLYYAISDSPQFFIDILCFLYQPDDEKMLEQELAGQDPDFLVSRAQKAYKLLDNWDVVPGTTREPDGKLLLDSDKLKSWVTESRQLAQERFRLKKADLFIGKILAKYPEGEDYWPPDPVAAIIDEINTTEMKDNFRAATMNKRSSSSRSPFAGGQRERTLSAYFLTLAEGHRLRHPVTASVLENMAASWVIRAKEEDNDALLNDLE